MSKRLLGRAKNLAAFRKYVAPVIHGTLLRVLSLVLQGNSSYGGSYEATVPPSPYGAEFRRKRKYARSRLSERARRLKGCAAADWPPTKATIVLRAWRR